MDFFRDLPDLGHALIGLAFAVLPMLACLVGGFYAGFHRGRFVEYVHQRLGTDTSWWRMLRDPRKSR